MTRYSDDSYQALAAAFVANLSTTVTCPGRSFKQLGVAVDDDVFGAVGRQDRSDRRKVLLVAGLVRDRVVRNEVPSHDASDPDSRGRANATGCQVTAGMREGSHAGGWASAA